MTLAELFEHLKSLPGHDNLVLEDYRITQEVYDPSGPNEVHYYLTGPQAFYIYMSIADEGYETNLAEYIADAGQAA